MLKHKKTTIAALIAIVAFVAFNVKHEQIIVERFPDLDPKIVRKVYRKVLRGAYAGKYPNVDFNDEEALDSLFLAEYNAYLRKN